MKHLVATLALCLGACTAPTTVVEVSPPEPVMPVATTPWNVTRVVVHHSTYDTRRVGYPSDGPGQTWVMTRDNTPDFDVLVGRVLDDTKIDDAVTVRRLIELQRSNDVAELARIDALGQRLPSPSGSGVNNDSVAPRPNSIDYSNTWRSAKCLNFGLFDGDNELLDLTDSRIGGVHVRALLERVRNDALLAPADPSTLPPGLVPPPAR